MTKCKMRVFATIGVLFGATLVVGGQASLFRLSGDVPHPLSVTVPELAATPRTSVKVEAHGQKGTYEGVTARELLTRAVRS